MDQSVLNDKLKYMRSGLASIRAASGKMLVKLKSE